jgi:hypothetical protein
LARTARRRDRVHDKAAQERGLAHKKTRHRDQSAVGFVRDTIALSG